MGLLRQHELTERVPCVCPRRGQDPNEKGSAEFIRIPPTPEFQNKSPPHATAFASWFTCLVHFLQIE